MRIQKQKLGVMIALLFITIGFAAITTVLIINGTVSIGQSQNTFDEDVIFTKAQTINEGMALISPDGKSITFETNELTEMGEETTLNFDVTNKSRIYDADAVIECTMKSEENVYNDYISISVEPSEFTLPASETKEGVLTVKLIKAYIGDGAEIEFSCTINANAIERDTEADEIVIDPSKGNSVSGYLFDENNNPLANTTVVIVADKIYYATTDNNGYYEIAGLTSGSYPMYVMPDNKTLEEIKNMTTQEIKENALSKGQVTTGNNTITFDNGYSQETNETVTKYEISFDTNGGNIDQTKIQLVENATYGDLPIPTRTGYTFSGWYTEATGGTQINSNDRITSNQTLYAHWTGNLVNYIIDLSKNDTVNLAYDTTSDKNLRYIGKSPNNYVKFNNELWRIIGVMNNITDSTGNKASHVKIIRASSIGSYSWDNKPSGTGTSTSSNGSNDWTDSTLQVVLNNGPYWNRTSGTCPSGQNGATTACDFSGTGLTNEAKNMISNVVWNLGGWSSPGITTANMYTYERGTTVYSGRPTTWKGYVGLMYPSDYGYSVGGSVRSACLNTNLSSYNTNSCYTNDWLYNNANTWMLSPNSHNSYYISSLTYTGFVFSIENFPHFANVVLPVVYLNSNIQVVSGSGTSGDPYIIK